jgi:hypothetical protein
MVSRNTLNSFNFSFFSEFGTALADVVDEGAGALGTRR